MVRNIAKIILIVFISALIVWIITTPVHGVEITQSHIILMVQDQDTEIELTVDGEDRGTMYLQPGINYLSYKTDGAPDVEVLVYGDTLDLKMTKGRGQDWYTFQRIDPPKDGDGYAEK